MKFIRIPLMALYVAYIPIGEKQFNKKNPIERSVLPPTKWGRNNKPIT